MTLKEFIKKVKHKCILCNSKLVPDDYLGYPSSTITCKYICAARHHFYALFDVGNDAKYSRDNAELSHITMIIEDGHTYDICIDLGDFFTVDIERFISTTSNDSTQISIPLIDLNHWLCPKSEILSRINTIFLLA